MKLSLSILITLFLTVKLSAQMDIQKLKTQLPTLILPFETPTNLPESSWDEVEINMSDYPYLKKDITELYNATLTGSIDQNRFYGIGYLSLQQSTVLVYLWANFDNYTGEIKYSIRLDTYDTKGEIIDHAILFMENYYSDLEESDETYYSKDYATIYSSNNTFYLKRTTETEVIRNSESDTPENLLISSQKNYDLLEILSTGEINPLYVEGEE